MRSRILVPLIAVTVLLPSFAAGQDDPPGPSSPRPDRTVRAFPNLNFRSTDDLPATLDPDSLSQMEQGVLARVMLRARREVINRQLDARLRERFPDRDSTAVRAEHGVNLDPDLARFGDARIRRHLGEVARIYRDRRRLPTGSRLSRVPFEVPPAGEPEVTTHLAMSTAASVIGAGQAVAAIVHVNDLRKYGDTWYMDYRYLEDLEVESVGPCEFVEFIDGPVVEMAGTCFLIEQDRVATASHVADEPSLATNYRVIFGYAWDGEDARVEFTDADVYVPKERIFWSNDEGRDVAVIQLDRPVVGRTPLGVGWPSPIKGTDRVYALGHPYGLPLTETNQGGILDNQPCNFFSCDIEVAVYNSGSPVINAESDVAVGIVATDFAGVRTYCGCWADSPYKVSDGRAGVVATRIGVVSEWLDDGDSAHVYNMLAFDVHASSAGIADSAADDFFGLLTVGVVEKVPAGSEVKVVLDDQCMATFTPSAGETWYIKAGPAAGTAEVLRCPRDGVEAGSY